jgi:hypothetical protein
MPSYEDVPFQLKNYAAPKTMVVGVTDRRTGADTLVILTGTVILTGAPAGQGGGGVGVGVGGAAAADRIRRDRVRFVLPQTPRVITAGSQVRGMQVVTALASIRHRGDGDRTFAIDQSVIEWANDLRELRVTIDTACQGAESAIHRVMYHAMVLAQTGG